MTNFQDRVLTEWNNLKETIRGHQQYQWGRLLTNLGLRIMAPHLSLELITREIKAKLNQDEKKSFTEEWLTKFNALKREVDRTESKVIGHSTLETYHWRSRLMKNN